ncbi:MAG: hypothetical protein K0Q49_320 [Haloplasmataceae bacterium]|jgi:exodeoxyribonuclease V alpha subunit|nr:hypothetical protein [Haloplasmataceae bacterium]
MRNSITGWFKREIFFNNDNSYLIGKIQVLKSNMEVQVIKENTIEGLVTVVGYMPKLLKDETYHFYGDFVKSNYGPQFLVESYEAEEKKDHKSLIEFLSSDLFKGIGKSTAKKIVDSLGVDAIDKILKDQDVLTEIGIKPNTVSMIYEVLLINYESEKIIRFLLKNGFGSKLSRKIFKLYKQNTINYLNENPYRLINDIEGIGFKKADAFAFSLNYDLKSPYRIQAAIKYTFEEFCFNEGFTYILLEQLMNQANAFLNENNITLTDEEIQKNIDLLVNTKNIIKENDKYYLPNLHNAENSIAGRINALIFNDEEGKIEVENISEIIKTTEEEAKINYTDKQRQAIEAALLNKVLILTGGPGTGKTTVVNGIIKAYIKLNELSKGQVASNIALVAPTGRAAKRLKETTGCDASTIHRMLGYQVTGNFSYDERNKLEQKLFICDESSMVDVTLCANFLKAIKNDAKVIFVGDENQLPSVGPGEVLKDLIASNCVTTIKLDKIHRQSGDSSIITLAHEINEQIVSSDLLIKQKDRNFICCNNDKILDHLEFIFNNAITKGFSIDGMQVLAPMYKGTVGIDNINNRLQSCINPKSDDKKEITHFNRIFRVGDKVIQLVNKPDQNVMNGDIGYIKHIFLEKESDDDTKLIVDFDGNEVKYQEPDLFEIALAYCISIHKSQGSEFEIVVLVLSKSYSIMLRKKLIYTAVTRAKKFLILLGDVDAFGIAVNNTRETVRQTTLKEKLLALIKTKEVVIDEFKFNYVKMEKFSPYDFME